MRHKDSAVDPSNLTHSMFVNETSLDLRCLLLTYALTCYENPQKKQQQTDKTLGSTFFWTLFLKTFFFSFSFICCSKN